MCCTSCAWTNPWTPVRVLSARVRSRWSPTLDDFCAISPYLPRSPRIPLSLPVSPPHLPVSAARICPHLPVSARYLDPYPPVSEVSARISYLPVSPGISQYPAVSRSIPRYPAVSRHISAADTVKKSSRPQGSVGSPRGVGVPRQHEPWASSLARLNSLASGTRVTRHGTGAI